MIVLNAAVSLLLIAGVLVGIARKDYSVALLCLGVSYLIRVHEQLREILKRLRR